MSRAVRVPRLAQQASKIEAEGASRLQQFRVAGEHGEDGIEKACVCVCVRERKREREREGRVQVVVCPWLR